jgi:hypothetical protein
MIATRIAVILPISPDHRATAGGGEVDGTANLRPVDRWRWGRRLRVDGAAAVSVRILRAGTRA